MQRLKILYRKNLKMTPGKLAAQCVHAAAKAIIGENYMHETDIVTSVFNLALKYDVIVLGVSDKKFNDIRLSGCYKYVLFSDAGNTEVNEGEITCMAYWENNNG